MSAFSFFGILLLAVARSSAGDPGPVPTASSGARPEASPWKASAKFRYAHIWDGNLFLQDETELARRSSWGSRASVAADLRFRPSAGFEAEVHFEGGPTFYYEEPSENHWSYKLGGSAAGKTGWGGRWSAKTDFALVDGSSETPVYTGPGGAPCFGGLEVMARRDAFHWTGATDYKQPVSTGYIRPLVAWKYNDFRTAHRAVPGYLNYTDRADIGGGLDVGWKLFGEFHFVTGYRIGYQWEDHVLEDPTEYSSLYQRALFGFEGKPLPWLSVSALAGPDFRDWESNVAPGFDENEVLVFLDATVEAELTRSDRLTLKAGRFEQPGFCGRSAYEDISYGATWKHAFHPALGAEAGVLYHGSDFQGPVNREDWILTATAALEWRPVPDVTVRATYQYDDGRSRVPETSGREYTRHSAGIEISLLLD
jgi:hypothetical protein